MINQLPQELQLEIFKKMDIPTFLKMRQVSKFYKILIEYFSKSLYQNLRRHDKEFFPKIEFSSENKTICFQQLIESCQAYFKNIYYNKVIHHKNRYTYPYYAEILEKYSVRQLKQTYELLDSDFYLYTAVSGGKLSKKQVNGMLKLKKAGFYDVICLDAVTKTHTAFVDTIIRIKSMTNISDYLALKSVMVLDFIQINSMINLKLEGMADYYSLKASKLLPLKQINHIIKFKKMGYPDYKAFREVGIDVDNKDDWFVNKNEWDFDFKRYYEMSGGICME